MPEGLAFSARGTCVRSSYGRPGSFRPPFSLAPGFDTYNQKDGCPFPGLPPSRRYDLRRLPSVSGSGFSRVPSPMRREYGMRRRKAYRDGIGILTDFPFVSCP